MRSSPSEFAADFGALGLVLNVGTKLSIFVTKHLSRSSKLSNDCCKHLVQIAIAVANKVSLIKKQLF